MRPVVCIVLLSLAASAHAADAARARLDTVAKGLTTVTASFSQTLTDANGGAGKTTRGFLALKAPRQFRWDVTAPYQQQIVADGLRVWVYDPDLEQVTVRNQGVEEAHSPLTVLTDLSQLDHDFRASEQGERDGLQWLRLTPKADQQASMNFTEIRLWYKRGTLGGGDAHLLPRMARTVDRKKDVDLVQLVGVKTNQKVDETFDAAAPQG